MDEGKYSGALSRRDNKTEICSACGFDEAIQDYKASLEKGEV
jgi:ribosomal protein L37E